MAEHVHGHHGAAFPAGADPTDRDANEAVWQSEVGVTFWKSTASEREQRRGAHRLLMAELLPFDTEAELTFADLGAGTGAAARTVLDAFPRARAVLADFSAQMMAQGATELAAYEGRYEYVEFDLADSGGWPDGIPARLDAVISSLAVHHLPDARKQELFAEIRDHLVPGGWFIIYDPVRPADPVVEEAWNRVKDRRDPGAAAKRDQRLHSPEDRLRYEAHTRYMRPLEPQLAFLREAGFEGVDVYWKELDYVVYGGRRPRP